MSKLTHFTYDGTIPPVGPHGRTLGSFGPRGQSWGQKFFSLKFSIFPFFFAKTLIAQKWLVVQKWFLGYQLHPYDPWDSPKKNWKKLKIFFYDPEIFPILLKSGVTPSVSSSKFKRNPFFKHSYPKDGFWGKTGILFFPDHNNGFWNHILTAWKTSVLGPSAKICY